MLSEDKRAHIEKQPEADGDVRLAHVVAFLAIVALIAWVQARDAPHWRAFLATLIFFVIVIVAYLLIAAALTSIRRRWNDLEQ